MNVSETVLVTTGTLRGWPMPEPGSDKKTRGQLLVVGGSRETPGAVLLAGEAALRSGAGLLQLATAQSVTSALAVAVPEALVLPLPEQDGRLGAEAADDLGEAVKGVDVVLLGPGLLDVESSVALMSQLVPQLASTVVIDALASAFLTEHPDGLHHLGGRCVLTANPTELSRVLRRDEDEVTDDPVGAAVDAARRLRTVVLCGGTVKAVATPEGQSWLARYGGPGLGASGSGDVQSGIVAGLLARGAEPAQAAVWGSYLHGRAGEELAVSVGPLGFLAREIPARLPRLLAQLV